MKHGNFVVLQMRPYEEYFAGLYSVANIPWYGVFEMKPYNHGNEDTVEKSYKVNLVSARNSRGLFPDRAWYTDIFNGMHRPHKEFDAVNEAFKADGFCKIQNERLKMLRDIKTNPDTHIWFKDTKGDIHQFFYSIEYDKYFEKENGELVADEDGIVFVTDWEMEEIMFKIDWEYNEPMKIKYNSFIKKIKHFLNF